MATNNHSSDQQETEHTGPWPLRWLTRRPSLYWLFWGPLFLLVLATEATQGAQAATTLAGNVVCLNLVTLLVLTLLPARDIVGYLSQPIQKLTRKNTNDPTENN